MRTYKMAQDHMKLEILVKTDDGKVMCHHHQMIDESQNNASKVQMASDDQMRHENVDQNPLHKPKEESCFSKFMSCCKSEKPKPLANREQSDATHRAERSNLKPTDKSRCSKLMCCCGSNESQPSASEEKMVVPTSSDNFPSKFTSRNAVQRVTSPISTGADVVANEPAEKRIRPKTSLRDDEEGHWPMFDKKPLESMCKMVNCQNRTRVYCKKCDLHLCFNVSRNCFYNFHKQNHQIRVDRDKTVVKSSENPRRMDKSSKPSSGIRTNKMSRINSNVKHETMLSRDRNKNRFQRHDIPKDATKEETKSRLVPLKRNRMTPIVEL